MLYFSDQIPQITINGNQINGIGEEQEQEGDQSDGKQNTTIEDTKEEPSEIDPDQTMYHTFSFYLTVLIFSSIFNWYYHY